MPTTKKLSALTIRRLRRVKAAILAEPKLYDQETCALVDKTCGTPACLLGWAVFLFSETKPRSPLGLVRAGGKALGLPVANKGDYLLFPAHVHVNPLIRLFEPGAWPQSFSDQLSQARSERGKALVAARRIEHFIATGGAE